MLMPFPIEFIDRGDTIVLNIEEWDNSRTIYLDADPDADVDYSRLGYSVGRWEGDTLVVETKHFNTWHRLRGYGVENLTVIERFRRSSDNKLIYGFTVDDPSTFTTQFSGEFPLSRIEEPLYEYACHEGNYGMVGILAGARTLEVQGED